MKHVIKAEVTGENLREVLRNVGLTLINNMKDKVMTPEDLAAYFAKIIHNSLEFGITVAFSIQSVITSRIPKEEKDSSMISFIDSIKAILDAEIKKQQAFSEELNKGRDK